MNGAEVEMQKLNEEIRKLSNQVEEMKNRLQIVPMGKQSRFQLEVDIRALELSVLAHRIDYSAAKQRSITEPAFAAIENACAVARRETSSLKSEIRKRDAEFQELLRKIEGDVT